MSADTVRPVPEVATYEARDVALAAVGALSRWENEGGALVYKPLAPIVRRDSTDDGSR